MLVHNADFHGGISDYNPDQNGSTGTSVVSGGMLYFVGWGADFKNELYKTDGTSAGTAVATNFSAVNDADITDLRAFHGKVICNVQYGSDYRLAITNGTITGSSILSTSHIAQ